MKIILLVLHKLEDDTLRKIKPSISCQKKNYIHKLQESRQVDVKQIGFTDNFANLFIKSLSISTFKN